MSTKLPIPLLPTLPTPDPDTIHRIIVPLPDPDPDERDTEIAPEDLPRDLA